MAILMTKLCEQGVDLIWKQCDEEKFPQGVEYLKEAMLAGDPEALFFLGFCYSWGEGALGFNDQKSYECYKEGARAGSFRCLLGALRAGQYDEGIEEVARHTPKESYEAVLAAAEEGDSFSAYQIALALEWEEPVVRKLWPDIKVTDCFNWYEKAAEGGIVNAMVKAGKCCMEGSFIRQDKEKGLYFAGQAASSGNAWGLYHTGLYFQERGNDEAAVEYFLAASSQGSEDAPYCLGKMYLTGEHVTKDIGKAVEFFEMAADRENTQCLVELGDIFYCDEIVERDNEQAFFWYSRAYAVGDKRAALPLGHLYMSVWERQDYHKAEKYFKEALEMDESGNAALELGNLYRFGVGREPNIELALLYYEEGAESGNAECMEILGNIFFLGEEAPEDYQNAFYWLDTCRQKGTLQSFLKLGFLYTKGYGCEANEELAKELLEIAAGSECDGAASYELGYLYERRGESGEDLEIAAEYYQRAIDMGNASAMRRFAHFKRTLFGKWKVVY